MFYERVFRELNERKIAYVVAGGMAVNLHGFVRGTMDLDIVLLLEDANISKFIDMVRDMGFKPRVPVMLADFAKESARTFWIGEKGVKVFCVYNPERAFEQIDVMIDTGVDFRDLDKRKVVVSVHGIDVPLVSIEDLIDMKRRVGRPVDLIDVERLRQLMELDDEHA